MALGIRRADRVNTVSSSYSKEILEPSLADTGFIGGEGLEGDLRDAAKQGRLFGILNGCYYESANSEPVSWRRLIASIRRSLIRWQAADKENESHNLALLRLESMPKVSPSIVLTSVGRLVDQKVSLLLERTSNGTIALDAILNSMGPNAVFIFLGTGDLVYEQQLHTIACQNSNFIFLRGYSDELSDLLFRGGHAFLMPSSFEPCGISQMLAMRAGQPCIVHGVGGLRDTVKHDETGFVFNGSSALEQADNLVACVDRAIQIRNDDPIEWDQLSKRASKQRFHWQSSARQYIKYLYE
jgi:starch synthase